MIAEPRRSLITNVPPSYATAFGKDTVSWLEAKRKDDNVEDGLWRIKNTLYNLKDFIDKHPGGSDWIRMTEGHDITEAFITHHISMEKVEPFLQKFRVRETNRPRNVKLTFDEDGFYMTLRRKVETKLPEIQKRTKIYTKFYIDGLFVLTFITAILAQRYHSYVMALMCGLCFTWCGISGHNFFHRRDNFRMKYFNLLLMSYRDWRVSHALSHHLYPNSYLDIELVMSEPIFVWSVTKDKSFVQRYVSYIYAPIFYCFFYQFEFFKKVIVLLAQRQAIHLDELLPLSIPLVMYLFGGNHSLLNILKMYGLILVFGSIIFSIIGLNAGHHHPEIVHDGDKLRDGYDWGLYSIDTIMDRQELRGNTLLALANFGDHALHHLFPTLDHGLLPELYDMFFETLLEFESECQCYPWFFETITGQFKQLSRTEPMTLSSHERYLLKNGLTSKLVNGKPVKTVKSE